MEKVGNVCNYAVNLVLTVCIVFVDHNQPTLSVCSEPQFEAGMWQRQETAVPSEKWCRY